MACPYCNSEDLQILGPVEDGSPLQEVECVDCGKTFLDDTDE